MNRKQEIISEIRKMPVEEIFRYKATAEQADCIINVLGVCTLFMMLAFPNVGMIISGIIFIFLFSNMSVGISELLKEIAEELKNRR